MKTPNCEIIEKFSLSLNKVRLNSWQIMPSILPVTFSGILVYSTGKYWKYLRYFPGIVVYVSEIKVDVLEKEAFVWSLG